MATITLDADYHDDAGLNIPLLGLHIGPGETIEMSEDDARGFLGHPHIAVAGLADVQPPELPVSAEESGPAQPSRWAASDPPADQPTPTDRLTAPPAPEVTP